MSHADQMSTIFAEDDLSPEGVEKTPRTPRTLRAGWQMPSGTCSSCGAKLKPVAYCDLDGWGLTLDCTEVPDFESLDSMGKCGEPQVVISWPFVEEAAGEEDFLTLGFAIP